MRTEKAVFAAKPGGRDYNVANDGGMHLLVTRAGTRRARVKYSFGAKEKRLFIWRHPDRGPKAACLARGDAHGKR